MSRVRGVAARLLRHARRRGRRGDRAHRRRGRRELAAAAVGAGAHGAGFRTQREIEVESLRHVLARFESGLDAETLSSPLFEYWAAPRAKPDAARFLRELDRPVCVVSNIDRSYLDRAIASLGWSFERIVTSEGCRAYKPRGEPFEAGLAALGRRADEVLHVGDSIGSDLRGAAAAGIAAAWLNPAGREKLAARRYLTGLDTFSRSIGAWR